MSFWISMITSASTSLRAASRVTELVLPLFNVQASAPSWYTGRLWLMRLGYYKLFREKEISNDWIWIIDHSIQSGPERCLMVLGIRLCDLPKNRALTFKDVEPIELMPVKKSNGEIVYEQLRALEKKTGIPRAIVADKGHDIQAGITRYCDENENTCYVYDIKHGLSNILKNRLGKDEDWQAFIARASKVKLEIQQTALVALAPPQQKAKTRYMNLGALINWSKDMLAILDQERIKSDDTLELDLTKLEEKLGWLREYSEQITLWNDLLLIIITAENFVRKNGLYLEAEVQLKQELSQLGLSDASEDLQSQVLHFVKNESSKAKSDEVLLGSSEIIESLFGKLKVLEKQQSKSGFTGLILGLAAFVSETKEDVIKQAMSQITTRKVRGWCEKNIKRSVQSMKAQVKHLIRNAGTKMEPEL